jgi:signal recognition particle subunit SRP54
MKQMGGMMGMPGMRRKATKSPKNKRKGGKGGGGGARQPRLGGGMPQLPAGFDPASMDPNAAGLPAGFKLPKLDFSKLQNRDKDS